MVFNKIHNWSENPSFVQLTPFVWPQKWKRLNEEKREEMWINNGWTFDIWINFAAVERWKDDANCNAVFAVAFDKTANGDEKLKIPFSSFLFVVAELICMHLSLFTCWFFVNILLINQVAFFLFFNFSFPFSLLC